MFLLTLLALLNTISHVQGYSGCDYKVKYTNTLDNVVCQDGTQFKMPKWGNCDSHGGRAKCPSSSPYMCANRESFVPYFTNDHRCLSTEAKCLAYGGLRKCQFDAKPTSVEQAYDRCVTASVRTKLTRENRRDNCMANMGAVFTDDFRIEHKLEECEGQHDWMKAESHHLEAGHKCRAAAVPEMKNEYKACSIKCAKSTWVGCRSCYWAECKSACMGIVIGEYFDFWYVDGGCTDGPKKCVNHYYQTCHAKCKKVFHGGSWNGVHEMCKGACAGNLVSYLMPEPPKYLSQDTVEGKLWIGPKGSDQCSKYTDYLSCVRLAKWFPGLKWERDFETGRTDWPKGCGINVNEDWGLLVYWNPHGTGGPNPNVMPVCASEPWGSYNKGYNFNIKMGPQIGDCRSKCQNKILRSTMSLPNKLVCVDVCTSWIMSKYRHHFYGVDDLTELTSGTKKALELETEESLAILQRLLKD